MGDGILNDTILSDALTDSFGGYHMGITAENIAKKYNISRQEMDIFELNEAFSAQAIACNQLLNINDSKVNPNGGAIALGHPVGVSGARILVSLIYELINSGKHNGITSLCVGGGMGVATAIRR